MRFDINILWVDDSVSWQGEQKELLEMYIEKYGLLTNIEYIENVEEIISRIKNEIIGFKKYDIIFVDYNISSDIFGNQLIDLLRANRIDADILFYSANNANDMRKVLIDSSSFFEGIYIANRDSFQDKALKLYEKNIRNLLSLSNIRGFLADKTSEIDYIMNSYILRRFNDLSNQKQKEALEIITESIDENKERQESSRNKFSNIIKQDKINSKALIDISADVIPLETKYKVFDLMLESLENHTFDDNPILIYIQKVVKYRNMVAHRKLDVCRQQKYILHFNHIKQFEDNQCPDDCSNHNDDRKISIDEWYEIIKITNTYSQLFDDILNELLEKNHSASVV